MILYNKWFFIYFIKNRGNYKDSYKIEGIKIILDVYVKKKFNIFTKGFLLVISMD